MYDIFVPTASNMKGEGGFRINSNDPRLTPEIRKCLYKFTRTFVSTVDNKSVRGRFLGKEILDAEKVELLSENVAASMYTLDKLVKRWINKQRKHFKGLYLILCRKVAMDCDPDALK